MAWLADLGQDLKQSLRLLRRAPLFTATAALSLSIGIGANTAIVAVANSLLVRPPDGVSEPDALVDIGIARDDGGLNPLPYPSFEEIRRRATSFSGIFAQRMFTQVVSLAVPGETTVERAVVHSVTRDFFQVLGARPSAGRVFNRADEQTGRLAVLDYGFWARRFNRDPAVIGRPIRVNGELVTVVGVADRRFQGTGVDTQDLWLPMATEREHGSVTVVGRLRAGVTTAMAAAEIAAIGAAGDRRPDATPAHARLRLLPLSRVGGNRSVVAVLAGVLVALVSLIFAAACANVAGILLARSFARTREFSMRSALGAGRGRLVRQLLAETTTLFLIGGAAGLVLARVLVALAPRLLMLQASIAVPVALDLRVFAFALGLSLFAALLTGVLPAMRASKADPIVALKEDGRSVAGRSRLRSAFVVAQIAISVLIVALAALFVRALRYAGAADPGFDPRGVEIVTFNLSAIEGNEGARDALWRDVLAGVRALPRVQAASLARVPPGGWEGIGLGDVAAVPPASNVPMAPAWNIVDTGYFETLRIPFVDGRDFLASDTAGAPPVAIVGESVARQLWPGRRAIGEFITRPGLNAPSGRNEAGAMQVVGVVNDIRSSSLIDGLAAAYVYLPRGQSPAGFADGMAVVARSRDGARLAGGIAGVIHDLNPNLVVVRSDTLGDAIALGLAPQRVLAGLASALGLVGLLLASIGVYGIVAFTVVRRRQEFGIRMALGARRSSIVWMVLKQGLLVVGPGAIAGLGLAAVVGQVLSSVLYNLPALHAPTFVTTALVFLLVGAAACYLPARRAVSVEPLRALRDE